MEAQHLRNDGYLRKANHPKILTAYSREIIRSLQIFTSATERNWLPLLTRMMVVTTTWWPSLRTCALGLLTPATLAGWEYNSRSLCKAIIHGTSFGRCSTGNLYTSRGLLLCNLLPPTSFYLASNISLRSVFWNTSNLHCSELTSKFASSLRSHNTSWSWNTI
jgi:hypothetical protein